MSKILLMKGGQLSSIGRNEHEVNNHDDIRVQTWPVYTSMKNSRGSSLVKNIVLMKRLGHNLSKLKMIPLGGFSIFITT